MNWYLERLSDFASKTAFVADLHSISYEDLATRVDAFRSAFSDLGVARGCIVILEGQSDAAHFAAIVAAMSQGLVAAPLTPNSPLPPEIAARIAGANYVIGVSDSGLDVVKSGSKHSPRSPMIDDLVQDQLGGLILFSSGSTGTPKAILYDSERLLAKFVESRPPIRALSFLMLDHFGGLNTVFAVTASGGELITLSDRRVDTVCAAVARHRISVLPVTPSFLRLLLASDAHRRHDLSSVQKITYGTEPMTASTLKALDELFPGVELQQTYGLSEIGVLRSRSRSRTSLWMSIGGEGFEWRVKDDVLWIKSAYRMRGYLNDSADFDADGFFNTQDRVEVDGPYLRILGRSSDIINVGGEKVYPAEIESVVLEIENILGALAYGAPNHLLGQTIALDVVLDRQEDIDLVRSRIRSHCRRVLGPARVPTHVRIVPSISVSGRQKTLRPRID